jgi:tripartite-type tricarboxylate transporter receptor subunit TctC
MLRSLTMASVIVLAVVARAVAADDPFPTRPITIVNPFPPGGHADLWCSTTGPAAPHVKSGKFRALAVTSAARHPHFDAPTLRELGYDVEYYLWIALFAPKATPAPVVKALREAIRQAVEDPGFKGALEKIQSPLAYQNAEEFRAWWDADARRLAEVIRRIGKIEPK